jgi:hypothetical protein
MDDSSTKSLMVDERQLARDVLDNLFEKTHCDCNVDWCLYEIYPELQIGKSPPHIWVALQKPVLLHVLVCFNHLFQYLKTWRVSLPSSEINPCLCFFVADTQSVEGSQALGDVNFITVTLLVTPKGKKGGNVVHPVTCLGSSSDCRRSWLSVC